MPQPKPEASEQAARSAARARWSVAAGGAAMGGFLFILSLGLSAALPKRTAEVERLLGAGEATAAGESHPTAQAKASDAASLEELRQNWPRFRGADGSGVSMLTNVPATWDAKTGAGIAWKVPVPASGFNSPIVSGDRVFFSGGDAKKREVFCLDGKTGQILWRQPVASVPNGPGASSGGSGVHRLCGFDHGDGWPAGLCDLRERRLRGIHPGRETRLVQEFWRAEEPLWPRNLPGHLAGPADRAARPGGQRRQQIQTLRTGRAHRPNRLAAPAQSGSFLGDAHRHRDRRKSAGHHAGRSMCHRLRGDDGAELWRAECLNGEITPSPVFAGGLLFVASPSEKLLAIRPDGQGDVTKTHVVWTGEDNVPDVTSPTSNGELVFAVTTSGMLTCLDAKDGKKQWEHDFDMECHASPAWPGTGFTYSARRELRWWSRPHGSSRSCSAPKWATAFMPARRLRRTRSSCGGDKCVVPRRGGREAVKPEYRRPKAERRPKTETRNATLDAQATLVPGPHGDPLRLGGLQVPSVFAKR